MLIPSLFQVEGGTANGTSERRNRFFRPIGPTLDPTLEVTDHRSRQFLLGRHFQIRVLVAQSLQKQWLESVDGLDGRPGVSSLLDQANVIEPEASFDFFCLSAVALVALLRQDRSNLALEKRLLLCHGSETERGQARDCPHDETKISHDANHVSDVPVKFQSVNCMGCKIEFFRKKKSQ